MISPCIRRYDRDKITDILTIRQMFDRSDKGPTLDLIISYYVFTPVVITTVFHMEKITKKRLFLYQLRKLK